MWRIHHMHVHVSKWEFRRGSSIMLGLSSTDKRTNLVCVCVCARVFVFVCISHLVWVLLSLTFCIRVCVNVGGSVCSVQVKGRLNIENSAEKQRHMRSN